MSTTSSQLQPVADPPKRLATEALAVVASRLADKPSASPLVAQITVRAIQNALEKANVNMPGTADRAAVIEIDPELAARAMRAVKGDLGAGDAITRATDVLPDSSPAVAGTVAVSPRPGGSAPINRAPTGSAPIGSAATEVRSTFLLERSAEDFLRLRNLDALRMQVAGGTLPVDHQALALRLLQN